jgi:hypothetical protein
LQTPCHYDGYAALNLPVSGALSDHLLATGYSLRG